MRDTINLNDVGRVELPNHNITLINCCDLIKYVEISILNDLHKYKLLGDTKRPKPNWLKLNTKDVKTPFYYHITSALCEFVSKDKGDNNIFYYSTCDIRFLELHEYVEAHRLKQFISTVFKQVSGVFPMTFHYSTECFSIFDDLTCGDAIDLIECVKSTKRKQRFASLEKIKNFVDKYKLKYVTRNYLTEHKDTIRFYK